MQKYDNLGQVFKNLRTNRHISLKQISNEAVSVSQISRFERGESDLSIGKFLIAIGLLKEPYHFPSMNSRQNNSFTFF